MATSAFAQRGVDIGSDAQRLAAEVQRESRYLSRLQATQIQTKFQEIRDILYKGNSGGPGLSNYTCISRDNDNRAPYVYAVRDGINMIRINAMAFSSQQSCQDSIESTRDFNGVPLTCMARDNDDRAPYVAVNANLMSGQLQQGTEAFQDIDSCWRFLGN